MDGAQFRTLMDALLGAYPDADGLKLLLKLSFNVVLGHIVALSQPHQMVVFDLITRVEAEGWLEEFFSAAVQNRPQNRNLAAAYEAVFVGQVAQPVQAAPVDFQPNGLALERIIDLDAMFQDPLDYIHKLAELVGRVCRVERGRQAPMGTGFLISCDTVLTNYHVVEKVIKAEVPAGELSCRFDYQIVGGRPAGQSIVVRTAQDWLVDQAPPSPHDEEIRPTAEPNADELDYAIIRLASPIGDQGRGWIELNSADYEFKKRMTLSILQHPEGDPIKLSGKIPATVGLNRSGNRVRYDVSTLAGSSGSPVFDQEWNLVALHHAGDPNFAPDHVPQFNQGIPTSKIYQLLSQREKLHLLNYN
jgi:hypothetical protein